VKEKEFIPFGGKVGGKKLGRIPILLSCFLEGWGVDGSKSEEREEK